MNTPDKQPATADPATFPKAEQTEAERLLAVAQSLDDGTEPGTHRPAPTEGTTTPRTDAEVGAARKLTEQYGPDMSGERSVRADFARTLERELALTEKRLGEAQGILRDSVAVLESADDLLGASDNMRNVHDGKSDYLRSNLSNAANYYRAKTPQAYSGALYNRILAHLALPPK